MEPQRQRIGLPVIGRPQAAENPVAPYFTVLAKPTGRCNLRCVFCYQNANHMLRGPRMSGDVQAALVRKVCEHPSESLSLQWIGGESLAVGVDFYKRCEELIQRHHRPGTYLTSPIQTNGTLLDHRWVEFLRECPRYALSISFEILEHLQNTLRAGGGAFTDSYTRVAENLRMLNEAGIPFGILTVIELDTLEVDPGEWLAAVVDHGIRQIGLQLSYGQVYSGDLEKVGRYVRWLDRLFLEQAEHNECCAPEDRVMIRESYYLYNLIRQAGVRFGCCHHSPALCTDFLVSVGEDGRVYGHCDSFMGIREEDGADYCIGSILESDFATVLRSPRMNAIRSALAEGREKCRPCSYFELCQGGCGFFKRMSSGSIATGFGDPIESYCAMKIGQLSYATDPRKAEIILRSYRGLNRKNQPQGYFIKTDADPAEAS